MIQITNKTKQKKKKNGLNERGTQEKSNTFSFMSYVIRHQIKSEKDTVKRPSESFDSTSTYTKFQENPHTYVSTLFILIRR